jgi:hypothetical protein
MVREIQSKYGKAQKLDRAWSPAGLLTARDSDPGVAGGRLKAWESKNWIS